jgi:hypothetical protein
VISTNFVGVTTVFAFWIFPSVSSFPFMAHRHDVTQIPHHALEQHNNEYDTSSLSSIHSLIKNIMTFGAFFANVYRREAVRTSRTAATRSASSTTAAAPKTPTNTAALVAVEAATKAPRPCESVWERDYGLDVSFDGEMSYVFARKEKHKELICFFFRFHQEGWGPWFLVP